MERLKKGMAPHILLVKIMMRWLKGVIWTFGAMLIDRLVILTVLRGLKSKDYRVKSAELKLQSEDYRMKNAE